MGFLCLRVLCAAHHASLLTPSLFSLGGDRASQRFRVCPLLERMLLGDL
jgi:hypothetical protein